MAKRGRKPTSKKGKRKQNNAHVENKNINVVIMIIVSILLGILIYQKTGYIGENLSPILGGIIGWIKFIIPIGTFVVALAYATNKKEFLSYKIFEYILFLVCICTILSIYQISENTINIKDSLSKMLSESYKLGTQNIGGGAIGTIIAVPLINMLGIPGAVVLTIGISIIILIFILGIPVADIIEEIADNMQERKVQRKEEIEEYRQKEYEERERKREERRKNRSSIKTATIDTKDEITEDQIRINLNNKEEKLKKYKHDKDDLIPLGKNKEEFHPNTLEDNLFKTQEEEKEEKTKAVLLLEHS